MRKFLLSLSLLVMSFMTAMAQYSVKVETKAHNNWLSGTQTLPLTEISAALGYADAEAMVADYNSQQIVWGILAETNEPTNESTSEPQGFWMNADGKVVDYGEAALWYALITLDADADAVNVNVGMMPNTATDGAEYSTVLTLKHDGKEVTINVNEVISVKEELEIQTLLSKLNIVNEYTATVTFKQGQTDDHSIEIDVPGIAEALGLSSFDDVIERCYGQRITFDSNTDITTVEDELAPMIAKTDGWFGRYENYDESTGTDNGYYYGLHSWGAGCTMYIHNVEVVEDKLSAFVGAYAGTNMTTEEGNYAQFYIINGNKAVSVKINIEINIPETITWEEAEFVAETTLIAEDEGDNGYVSVTLDLDIDEILEKLGAPSIDDLTQYNLAAEEQFQDPKINDYWVGEDGISIGWGNNACAKIYPGSATVGSLAEGKFTIMMMDGKYSAITEPQGPFNLKYYIGYGAKVYTINFQYTITPKEAVAEDFETVATEGMLVQLIPDRDNYELAQKTEIDLEYLAKVLGDGEITLLAYKAPNADGISSVTDAYSCDPRPGFWMIASDDKTSYAGAWGGNLTYGMTFAASSGVITWYNVPGARVAGDEFESTFVFLNKSTNKAVKYNMLISFVEEIGEQIQVVGRENATVVLAKEAYIEHEGVYDVSIDMTAAMEALGLDAELIESATVVAPKSSLTWNEVSLDEPITFDMNGYITEDEEAIAYQVSLHINEDSGLPMLKIDPMYMEVDTDEPLSFSFTIGLEYDGKRYLTTITAINEAEALSISNVSSNETIASIYNVAGARINSLAKGVNIVKMTNGAVKKVLVK